MEVEDVLGLWRIAPHQVLTFDGAVGCSILEELFNVFRPAITVILICRNRATTMMLLTHSTCLRKLLSAYSNRYS